MKLKRISKTLMVKLTLVRANVVFAVLMERNASEK